MTKDEHDALRAQTVADMHAMARPGWTYQPIDWTYALSEGRRHCLLSSLADIGAEVRINEDEPHRVYAADREGRRWLLDGSGDVA